MNHRIVVNFHERSGKLWWCSRSPRTPLSIMKKAHAEKKSFCYTFWFMDVPFTRFLPRVLLIHTYFSGIWTAQSAAFPNFMIIWYRKDENWTELFRPPRPTLPRKNSTHQTSWYIRRIIVPIGKHINHTAVCCGSKVKIEKMDKKKTQTRSLPVETNERTANSLFTAYTNQNPAKIKHAARFHNPTTETTQPEVEDSEEASRGQGCIRGRLGRMNLYVE